MLTTNEKEAFNAWLLKSKKFSQKSARDVLSRTNRTISYIGSLGESLDKATSKLMQSANFEQLSPYVKSQLKRATRLYFEFKNK